MFFNLNLVFLFCINLQLFTFKNSENKEEIFKQHVRVENWTGNLCNFTKNLVFSKFQGSKWILMRFGEKFSNQLLDNRIIRKSFQNLSFVNQRDVSKFCLKYVVVYDFENWLFFVWFLYKSDLRILYFWCKINIGSMITKHF